MRVAFGEFHKTYVKFLPKAETLSMMAIAVGYCLIVCVFKSGLYVLKVSSSQEACFEIEDRKG